ncbi:FtsW/RodA/SpoVE family cell cycle protein [Levilactobacillus namurensis]|uniref:FtsW/RodA/SpoVE family cell cycle protein n=1 Tax=Levilactobacillus namurensis TaxID=380393 RepID=UPI0026EBBBC0|nr:FtsW/RodA/SpoVE family cell cycle protein [Levilactobacillus namurensis]
MRKLKYLDYWLMVPYLVLSILGIVMVYSASADIGSQNGGSPFGYLVKQTIYVGLGLGILLVTLSLNLHKLRNKTLQRRLLWVALLSLLGLFLVGKTINGAAGWFRIGPVGIQPAEFMKFYLIIFVAYSISKRQDDLAENYGWWSTFMEPIVITACIVGLILAQPDLGGAAINATIAVVMFLASGFNYKRASAYLVGLVLLAVFVVLPFLTWLSQMSFAKNSYKLQRIVAFTHPFANSQDSGQQLVNSYYALSNGGVFGVGLGNSIQKTGYLPEPNTDFIMAILAEELGLVTALFVITLLFIMIIRIVYIGKNCHSAYYGLICYGAATYLTVQSFFNLGGVLGMLPITGVTFPFISYGGSSTLTLALVFGVVLNISARQKGYRPQVAAPTEENE